jgi:hypothetical protein
MAYRRTIKEQAARSRATSSVSHSMRWNVGISTTSCAPSPPRPPLALGDGHPPASPGSHEDFKATRKWTFLDDPEKRKAHGYRKISAWCGYSFASFSCCLSILNGDSYRRFLLKEILFFFCRKVFKNNCFDGFFLTGVSKNDQILLANPPSTEIGVPNMPSLKTKKLRKLLREKVLL